MSVWELYTQLFSRNWRCGRFGRSLSHGCSEMIRKKDVVMTAGRWSSGSIQIPQFLMLWWPVMKAGSTAMSQRPRDRVPSGSMLALPNPKGQREQIHPQTFHDSFFWQHWHDLHALGSHWTDSQQGILCWGFKGVQEEIPREEASTLEIGSVAFLPGQCSSLQLHPCHRLFDQHGHHDSFHPLYSPDLDPCDFWLFPKLRGCRYERIEEMKEDVIDMLTQDDFHGAFQKFLERHKCIAAEEDYFEGD